MTILSYAIATLIPLAVLYTIYSLDLYQMGAFGNVLVCFTWGMIAFGVVLWVNNYLIRYNWLTYSEIVRYFAPFLEELLKALILVYLVRRVNFTYFVDGAIYGFAAGMGFAIIENFLYINQNPYAGLGAAVGRVIGANLVHASASGLVGVAFGLSRFRRGPSRWLTWAAGLVVAILLHSLFNNIIDRQVPGPVLVYSTVIGLLGVGLIAFLIFRGLAQQKAWIEQALGMADRVSGQEVRRVQKIADIQEFLDTLTTMYGKQKAEQVEKFLFVQARIGILRKTLDKLPDETMRQKVSAQIAERRAEMESARKAVGPYVMMSVRSIFPEDSSPVFGLLQQRLDERLASTQDAPKGQAWSAAFGKIGRTSSQTKKSPDAHKESTQALESPALPEKQPSPEDLKVTWLSGMQKSGERSDDGKDTG